MNLSGRAPDRRSRLVVACLRVVDLAPTVDALTGEIRRSWCGVRASAADLAALEHALRIAEAWSARVLAVAMGPPTVDAVLREARAAGAEVLRIPFPSAGASAVDDLQDYIADLAGDRQPAARIVANAIRAIDAPALVLCGDRSSDRGTGDLAALLAHEFGAAQALGLVRLDPQQDHLIAERRLDRGGRERLRVPLPAVCSVETGGVHLRRANMRAAVAAADRPIPIAAESLPEGHRPIVPQAPRARRPRTHLVPAPSGDARERLLALTGVTMNQERATVTGPVSASDGADQLLVYLRRLGYLGGEKQGTG